jgi:diguanylate cyclase (GGDEF)-like protein
MRKILKEFRLIAVVGLLLIPIFVLGGFFVSQSKKDIHFAKLEMTGISYLRSVMPIYVELSQGQKTISDDASQRFFEARQKYDTVLKTEAEASNLKSLLAMPNVSIATKKRATRALITKIGDTSNLILDPNLDTYYLMEVSVLKLPDVMTLSHDLYEISQSQKSAPRKDADRLRQIELAAQLRTTILTITNSIAKIGLDNADASLPLRLAAISKAYLDVGGFNTKQIDVPVSVQNGTVSYNLERHNFTIASTQKYWNGIINELDALITKRIDGFQSLFYFAIGTTVILTLLALFMAVKVLHKLLARLDDQIIYLAHHDPMTQLKNRAAFTAEMVALLQQADATGEKLALHVIDCDFFKSINDTHGHQGGDKVLVHLANCLSQNIRKGDLVGRLGGDEFVVLQRHISGEYDAQNFADRVVKEMQKPIAYDQVLISAGVTMGIALYPQHANNDDALMLCADASLFAAKQEGRSRAFCYSRDFEAQILKRRELEQDVRTAIVEGRLSLNFQPQYDTSGHILRGFEALLRFKNRRGEVVSPVEFIPVAENIGMIVDYGKWVLNAATKSAALWPAHISLAVNLSPLQFKSDSISATVSSALVESQLAPQRLQLEITEGILLEASETVIEELFALRKLGVSLAMDDFGTGFSSLSYLWQFRFDKIKIDRSFMKALDNDRENAENIIKTIVLLGHSMDMEVAAEGVETPKQAELMMRLKCDEIQGFLYGKPMMEQDLPAVILRSIQWRQNEKSETQTEVKSA